MSGNVEHAIRRYARAAGKPLAPEWNVELRDVALGEGEDALFDVAAVLGWSAPTALHGRPRPDQFPLLVHDPDGGWASVSQWSGEETLQLAGERGELGYTGAQSFYALQLPDPLASEGSGAIDVFWRAIKRRKHALVMAGIATVFANLLTLATSLYSMQLYDRVIPLASFDTLLVLTVGVIFALLLDLALRSLRALLIEREAQDIDAEVSEFFFARAQAIRLDARPPGVGTMAAQLRGQEQIRQVLASGSLFMLADLPFALFFIAVIAMIGGPLALVPLLSLPIAIGLAWLLSSIIRRGTDRAQVSSNRKNGMLVESLDASETVKANRGGWLMMGRWNALVREIHHYEDPVKRASAVASSLFSTLQQSAFVGIMCMGAYLAATGQVTTGALLACSIIAGRINGPLVAQLPNLIVQWGYARSSLKALDMILDLPLDPTALDGAMRPGKLSGPIEMKDAAFSYGGQQAAVSIEELAFAPGERVAIVGGIGSGKSTLLKLLAGLYPPQAGSVRIGGLDLSQVADDVARRHIGYLPQDVRLVNGTLRDNLAMGIGGLSDDAIMDLARATTLEAMIASKSEGLSSRIEEGGLGLSGGQRGLVGINRMIHAKPQIWLLDEPTAALDGATENAVFTALDEALGAEDILIVVTHKMRLLDRFERVIVMQGGQVMSDGSAQQLKEGMIARRTGAQQSQQQSAPPEGTVTTRIRAPNQTATKVPGR